MSTQTSEHAELSIDPSEETLRQQLDIQWRDHWATSGQSWKTLQMVALLFVGYIGSGLKVSDPLLIRIGGVICMLAACFGIAITIHCRQMQITRFTFIYKLEKMLKLHDEKLLGGIKPPQPFSIKRVFHMREQVMQTFILVVHIAILFLAAAYVFERG